MNQQNKRRRTKSCQYDGCTVTYPVFNYEGQGGGRYCTKHKKPEMINVRKQRCQYDGCIGTRPSFNYEGQRAIYCVQHKKPGMIDVRNKRCQDEGCTVTSPVFNYEGQKQGIYCTKHKKPEMINVRKQRCQYDGCIGTQPVFNYEGQNQGIYCTKHKKPEMINVRKQRCQYDGCIGIRPVFNYEGQKRGIYCAQHKKPDMVDVISKRCQDDGCTGTRPLFNYEGQKRGIYCAQHKKPGMVDVVSKRCQENGCITTQPRYGKPGDNPRFCSQHRKTGMIVNPKKMCIEDKCSEIAIYGIVQATHCVIHRLAGEDNLIGQLCVKCGLIDIVNDSKECDTCDTRAQHTHKRSRLAKQRHVKLWLDDDPELNDYELYDRIIDGGTCGMERPDFLYDCGTHAMVLEVDERQHIGVGYTEWCTCSRMINVGQSKGMPIVFIRYNPDHYKTTRGRQATIAKRRDVLLRWLRYLKTTPPNYFSSVYQLFYDGYEESNVQEHCIQAFEN
jgi:hypothetical protein